MKAVFVFIVCCWCLSVAIGAESPHGDIQLNCNQCHVTTGWRDLLSQLNFDHNQTRYPLAGRHAAVQCIACHTTLKFADAGTACIDCHTDIHRGQFSNNCSECHAPDGWSMTDKMRERHAATRFPLIGVHAKLDCQACHANGNYVNVAISCEGCHLDQYKATDNPSHVAAAFSAQCNDCHTITTTAWKNAAYTHPASFPLAGGHAVSDCNRCHANGYANLTGACYPCHAEDFNTTTDPNHAAGGFSQNCAECHNTGDWQGATFNHDLSGFPLTGRHVDVSCAQCHVGGQYTGTPTDCYECHRANFEGTTNPDHEAGNYPHNCAVCHSTNGWQPASFDHNLTDFPLTGRHVDVSCAQCHVGGQYTGTPTDCYECHRANFEGTTNPDHEAGNYPHNCAVCHSTNGWQPASFDHNLTDFPLTGRHNSVNCAECHVGGNYTNTPSDCWSCHETAYRNTTNPDHEQLSFPQTCNSCHTTDGWSPASFDHNTTDFPLTGRHVTTTCLECHVGGNYANTPSDCWSCHETAYRNTTNPDHEQLSFPQTCNTCHTTNGWSPASFDHNTTDFPLTGRHVNVNCAQCHVGGNYNNTPTDCWSCHQTDYNGADDHASGNYPHDCAMCHNTNGWDSNFNHDNTDFPLTGRHVNVSCTECHVNGQFNGTPTDCWSCHQQDYNNAEDHLANNYPHDCLQCHTTSGWDEGFNHNNTGFPLTGAHIQTNCTACHVNGQFEGTPTDCFFCHEQAFHDANDPNHDAGFPHACADCHSTTGWTPAQFNHDGQWFPIYSGEHRNEWTQCSECHTDPNDFGVFSCIDCHEHSRTRMDNEHDEVSGYVYESQACYNCHPTGGGGGGPHLHEPQRRVRN